MIYKTGIPIVLFFSASLFCSSPEKTHQATNTTNSNKQNQATLAPQPAKPEQSVHEQLQELNKRMQNLETTVIQMHENQKAILFTLDKIDRKVMAQFKNHEHTHYHLAAIARIFGFQFVPVPVSSTFQQKLNSLGMSTTNPNFASQSRTASHSSTTFASAIPTEQQNQGDNTNSTLMPSPNQKASQAQQTAKFLSPPLTISNSSRESNT